MKKKASRERYQREAVREKERDIVGNATMFESVNRHGKP